MAWAILKGAQYQEQSNQVPSWLKFGCNSCSFSTVFRENLENHKKIAHPEEAKPEIQPARKRKAQDNIDQDVAVNLYGGDEEDSCETTANTALQLNDELVSEESVMPTQEISIDQPMTIQEVNDISEGVDSHTNPDDPNSQPNK